MARRALQLAGVFDQLAFVAVRLGHLPQLGHPFDGLVEGDFQFGRHQLGDAIHFAKGHAQNPPDIAHHRFSSHSPKRDDL